MSDKKNIFVIEQLNFLSFTIYLLFFQNSFESAVYINTSYLFGIFSQNVARLHTLIPKKLTRIYFQDFPGSWYEQKEETGMHVNDALFDKYCNNIYVSAVLKFCNDNQYSLAIRKELYNRYTLDRVKTFVFLKRLSEKYDQIILLPVDAEDIGVLLSEKLQPAVPYITPNFFKTVLLVKNYLQICASVLLYPIFLCSIALKFLVNGISVTKISKNVYKYGIDSFSQGIPWNVPYITFFIYNKTDFHPSKILHVVRSPLVDAKTEFKYQKYHYPYAIWNKQKTPIRMFISRILGDMLLKQMIHFFLGLFQQNKKTLLLTPCIATMKMTIEAEIFYSHYDVRVFISRDDYSPLHIIRTLVAHKNKSFTVGFMHGDYSIPGIETSSNLLFDNYALFGTHYRNLHEKGLSLCKNTEVIGAGIIGLDKTFHLARKGYVPDKYRELIKKYKIFLIVGGPFMDETESGFTKDLMIQYFEDILNLTDEYKDYYRIIKPTGDDRLDEELKKMLTGHERVLIDSDLWTYKIILISDLTFCYASSTVGLESIMAGKKVIFYDLYGYEKHPYTYYSPLLVATTPGELKNTLNIIIKVTVLFSVTPF